MIFLNSFKLTHSCDRTVTYECVFNQLTVSKTLTHPDKNKEGERSMQYRKINPRRKKKQKNL